MDVRHSHHACPGISQWLLANALASIISKISNLELKANLEPSNFDDFLMMVISWVIYPTTWLGYFGLGRIAQWQYQWWWHGRFLQWDPDGLAVRFCCPIFYSSKEKTLDHSYMCDSRYILVYHHGLEHWNPENNYRAIYLSLTALKRKQLGSLGFAGLDWEFTAKDNASKALSTLSTNLQGKSK